MEEAKAVHRCLRTAAGIFKFVKVSAVFCAIYFLHFAFENVFY